MRFIIGMLISFQVMAAPVANQLGQTKEESAASILLSSISEAEATSFTQTVRKGLDEYQKNGLDQFVSTHFKDLSAEDIQALNELKKLTKPVTLKFTENKPGHWSTGVTGVKASFSVLSIHQGYVLIDNEKFEFSGLTLAELKAKIDSWQPVKKTTFLKRVNNLIGIGEAQAIGPLVYFAVVGAVALVGYAVNKFKLAPERLVKQINDIKNRLEKKKSACENAPGSVSNFKEIADLIKPVKSYDDKFEAALKEMVQASGVKSESCYDSVHKASKAIKVDVPKLTEAQQSKLEQGAGNKKVLAKSDVNGALYDMCQSFSGLQNCLSNFTSSNINNMQYKMLDDETKERLNKVRPSAREQ